VGNIPVCACVSAGEIVCEPPNNHLNKFEGVLNWKDEKFALDNEKLLLRGCVLRNTGWCFGLVIFAGKDTKLMMNSGQTTFKRTHIDQLMNVLIVGVRVCCILFDALYHRVAFSDLTVLAWCQEGHPACKKLHGGVLAWLSGVRCRLFAYVVQLMHPKTQSSLASFKSRLVLPFLCRLTQVSWMRGH